jgi:N-glycosylase/DNA lyase
MLSLSTVAPDEWVSMALCKKSELDCKVCLQDGGQSFTWENIDEHTWCNVVEGFPIIIQNHPESEQVMLRIPSCYSDSLQKVIAIMNAYFRLDEDLGALYIEWAQCDPKFPKTTSGVRLLCQDPLETLFAFICSQNNAIHRIKSLACTLKKEFGQLAGEYLFEGRLLTFYKFPSDASVFLGSETKLREWKFGYRARYIDTAAKHLCLANYGTSQALMQLRTWSYDQIVLFLIAIPGIGRKVADCIALMSLDQLAVVPIDTHIWRVARERYRFAGLTPSGTRKTATLTDRVYEAIGRGFRDLFGCKAGWAHSVLFTAELRPFRSKK